mmetsp:Transcript_10888/g.19386  ORF Transcript_10888/g.19386 Transcript_10888/m.19386 type:complete len:478 (-) Transcript_10888:81-1514(-)|eukprot:CAMPEP_0197655700 /NCGR_PEP_ID=MMETSP1338-20131121/39616_1 /TAXON_ID=43686 ORGANISM="Pelagodinium beii, Strain RCC1491" /NCGR_SAMPLE_ID=MMETSP1338 /ASSEMBLY_ACC=CAM_ASM_000754 /LENGTH=477 /DNA_ID=CAMNT_0043231399 /DNA_START=109 /DNA_END=1542 /DNA_ORIENTATION=+
MALPKDHGVKGKRTLDDVIDDIGYGLAQLKVVILAGGCWMSIGALKLMHSMVSTSISNEWNLVGYQRGALVSACFAGQALGSCLGGHLSDKFGRRAPCVAMYALIIIFGVASITSWGFWSLFTWRLALGATFGLGTAPLLALINETTPSSYRMFNNALSACLFAAGGIFASGLVWIEDPSMQEIEWRTSIVATVLPAVPLLLLSFAYLKESPQFLASSKRHAEASEVLRDMQRLNTASSVDVTNWSQMRNDEASQGPALLWQGTYRFTFLAMCFSAVALNYSYYGSMYALPLLLPGKDMTYSPAASMMMAALCEPVGYFAGLLLARYTTRKGGLLVYLSGLSMCCAMFFFAMCTVRQVPDELFYVHSWANSKATISMSGVNLFNQIGFLFLYTYIAEVFPTSCRATALGVCGGLGRLGSCCAPFIVEHFVHHGGVSLHYVLVATLCFLNAFLVVKLPIETKDRQLGSIQGETEPLIK